MAIIIPAGTRFFHATCEPFPAISAADLRPGGDHVLWLAKDSVMAQTYIPESGSSMITSGRSFYQPSPNENDAITWLQKKAGLEFADVKWHGSQPQSYRTVKHPCKEEWVSKETHPELDNNEIIDRNIESQRNSHRKLMEIFTTILTGMGYHPYNPNEGNPDYQQWHLKTDMWKPPGETKTHWKIMPTNWRMTGRLFVLQTTRELSFRAISDGTEGSLLEPDHLKYNQFEAARHAQYDGILINDFAQTELGNFGHQSFGVFTPEALRIETILSAKHPEQFRERHVLPSNYDSPEFLEWIHAQQPRKSA